MVVEGTLAGCKSGVKTEVRMSLRVGLKDDDFGTDVIPSQWFSHGHQGQELLQNYSSAQTRPSSASARTRISRKSTV